MTDQPESQGAGDKEHPITGETGKNKVDSNSGPGNFQDTIYYANLSAPHVQLDRRIADWLRRNPLPSKKPEAE